MQRHLAWAATGSDQAAIESRLAQLGYRMEHSLSALEEDEGHAVIEIATDELVDPPPGEVLDLAIAWSVLEGACTTD
ncbi:MAG: hypothetical protein CFE45_00840 [Burkholderiales bacterium PBB5]|nr:MAG: hypothetical protein CFE45_00840 [Burkholderiales bacterium PBB5]